MTRSAQLIVNPSGIPPYVAPWVALTNAITQGAGAFAYDGNGSFAVQNAGAYHFVQDVAVPPADYTAVDAGLRAIDYDAYGALVSLASTLKMYLEARDVSNAVLIRYELDVIVAGKPYTQFTVRMVQMPPGTRTVRVGFQGNNGFGNSGWFDNLSLYFDDYGVSLTKGLAYVASGLPAGRLNLTKGMMYAIRGAGFTGKLNAIKNVLYGVTAFVPKLSLTKGVLYVVTGPAVRCGYDGVIMVCQDRPSANGFSECASRANSFASGPGARPTDSWFKDDQAIERCRD